VWVAAFTVTINLAVGL